MAPLLEYFEWHIAVPYHSSKKVKMRLNVASDTCQQNTDMVNPCKSTLSQNETYTQWVSTQIWLRSSHFKTSLQKLEGFEDLPQVYRVLASVWLVCLNIFSSGNVVETWWSFVELVELSWAPFGRLEAAISIVAQHGWSALHGGENAGSSRSSQSPKTSQDAQIVGVCWKITQCRTSGGGKKSVCSYHVQLARSICIYLSILLML